ncbi:MAG: flavodoxin-dependent (E)-4-hydroxy-3-methylbut-2-enyl-diphosphate synthase [Candidatus Fimadaptatus sp.]
MSGKSVMVGKVQIGGGAPVVIQSMTNTDTRDRAATLKQIDALYQAGCQIARVAVHDEACVRAVRYLVDNSPVPLVADIHFDYRLAIGAVENGISKVRINPGNIGSQENVRKLADCLKAHHVPVRIGVNSGSMDREIVQKYGQGAEAMVESALKHASYLEKEGFYDIVLSMKSSDVRTTVESYRLARKRCDYPLHVGVTEAGLPAEGMVKSAIGIGSLLLDGIGDTIRVSLTADPVEEIAAAQQILRAIGMLEDSVEVISCPTCGRTRIDVAGIARRVFDGTRHIRRPLKVAVMGCVVNGPGEARNADIGIAGGGGCGALFRKGERPVKVEGDLAQILLDAIEREIAGKDEAR